MEIDYRELLKKYILHVYNAEGMTFIPGVTGGHCADVELNELHRLRQELSDEGKLS